MEKKRHRKDFYAKKAKREGYKSRAAFKLQQIHQKFRLFRKGQIVVDLCGAPGGWSQIAKLEVGKSGKVILVDLQKLKLDGIHSIKGDITSQTTLEAIQELLQEWQGLTTIEHLKVDIILADCSPNVSGAWQTDHARQIWLSENALKLALALLSNQGIFVCKVFQGDLLNDFISSLRQSFLSVRAWKPLASRKESSELYLISKTLKIR
ncbi:MAG: RlmE family RNA methyltransferase [Promethearchaeota archaeon]